MRALLWVFVAAGLGLAARGLRPPEPLPADAPASVFSAERAFPIIEALAAAPRARPSPYHAASRAYLAEQLRALGLEPVEQESVVDGHPVTNLLARRAGTGVQPGAVLLCAHYDSVAAGPGAGDDALGCAVLLEAARALLTKPPAARDLILLFTDGEEIALLGARAFLVGGDGGAPPHPWAKDVALALNFEARGSGGPAWMFQTSPDNGALISALTRAPHPAGSSLAKAVYDRMPNDTDLTIFLNAGIPGMNWACMDRYSSYHTALDTPERLHRGTLQHMGEQGLVVADWALRFNGSFRAPDAVYFNLLGGPFVVHPLAWTRWLAVLPALGLALWLRQNRRSWNARARGLLASLIILTLAAVLALVLRATVPGPFTVVALVTAFTLLAVWLLHRRGHGQDLAAGSLTLWTVDAICLALLLPEGAFLLMLPVCVALAALLLPKWGTTGLLARGAALLIVLSLVGAWIYNLVLALGMPGVPAPALLAAFTVVLLAPLWIPPRAAPRS